MGPCLFTTYHLLASLTAKPIGLCQCIYNDLKTVFWDLDLRGSLCHHFLSVNRSGPGSSSATNQRAYNALVRLHGPLCKLALSPTYFRPFH